MKLWFRYFFIHSFFLFGLFSAKGQSRFSGWLVLFNSIKTGKKTSISLETQWRSSNQIKNLESILIRGGINYEIKNNMIITMGYSYSPNHHAMHIVIEDATEHRLWEQFIFKHSLKKIQISHRLRLEQRFDGKNKLVNNEPQRDGFAYSNGFRYSIRTILPLSKEPVFLKGFFAALQNEVFVNLGNFDRESSNLFGQNRFYLGTGYRIGKSLDLEIGYMNQYISGGTARFTNNHILQLSSYFRL